MGECLLQNAIIEFIYYVYLLLIMAQNLKFTNNACYVASLASEPYGTDPKTIKSQNLGIIFELLKLFINSRTT